MGGPVSALLSPVLEEVGRVAGRVQERRPLPADVFESDDAYLVVFDAPGAESRDVDVRAVGDRIEVAVDRFRQPRDGLELRFPGRPLRREGSVTLPADGAVDATGATSTLRDDGTLHVSVPKAGADSAEPEP